MQKIIGVSFFVPVIHSCLTEILIRLVLSSFSPVHCRGVFSGARITISTIQPLFRGYRLNNAFFASLVP